MGDRTSSPLGPITVRRPTVRADTGTHLRAATPACSSSRASSRPQGRRPLSPRQRCPKHPHSRSRSAPTWSRARRSKLSGTHLTLHHHSSPAVPFPPPGSFVHSPAPRHAVLLVEPNHAAKPDKADSRLARRSLSPSRRAAEVLKVVAKWASGGRCVGLVQGSRSGAVEEW